MTRAWCLSLGAIDRTSYWLVVRHHPVNAKDVISVCPQGGNHCPSLQMTKSRGAQTVVPGLSSREPRIDSPPAAVRSLPALLQPGQKGDRVASSTAQDNCAWLLCAQYATTHGQALWAPVPTPATSTASAAVFVFYLMSFTCLVEGLTSTQTAAFP